MQQLLTRSTSRDRALEPTAAAVDAPSRATWLEWIAVFLGFLLLGVAITWPMAVNMSSGFWGVANDNLGGAWAIELMHESFWGDESATFTEDLQAPYGLEIDQRYAQPFDKLFAIAFGGIGSGIFANNLAVLLSFPLSGLTMYALARYLTGNRMASALAGVIFAASPVHLAMAMNYNALASIQWCPLVVLAVLVGLRTRRKRHAALAGVALALVWYASFYYGWFALFIIAVMLLAAAARGLVAGIRRRQVGSTLREGASFLVTRVGLAAATFALFAIPALYPMMANVSSDPGGYARTFDDLYFASVRPWQFFLPGHDNPIFGEYTSEFIHQNLGILPVYEQSVYIGACALLLAVFALVRRRSTLNPAARHAVGLLGVTLVFSFFLSLGPYLPLNPFSVENWVTVGAVPHVKNITHYAYELSAAFRYYGRAWVWGTVCLAALAAIGFAWLVPRLRRRGRYLPAIAGSVLILVVLVEYSNRPSVGWYDAYANDDWSEVVAELPADVSIVQYPIAGWSTPRSFWYQYFQARHERATANPPYTPEAGELAAAVAQPDDPLAGETLHDAGIDYAVVHTSLPPLTMPPYQPQLPNDAMPRDAGASNPWFEEYATTADAVIYKVRDRPKRSTGSASLVNFLGGYYPAEYEGDREFRWVREPEATFLLVAGETEGEPLHVTFEAHSLGEPRELQVSVDGKPQGQPITISEASFTPVHVVADVEPGRHVVTLQTTPGLVMVSKVLGGADQREVSVRVTRPQVAIDAPGDNVSEYVRGFHGEERDELGSFRWLASDSGALAFTTRKDRPAAKVDLLLGSYGQDRHVRFRVNGRVVQTTKVPVDEVSSVTIGLPLKAGVRTILEIQASPGPQEVEGADGRAVSIRVFEPRLRTRG